MSRPTLRQETAEAGELVPWLTATAKRDERGVMAAAHVMIQGGYWRAAERYLCHVLESGATADSGVEASEIHAYLAYTLWRRGEYEKALLHYQRYGELESSLPKAERALLLNSLGNQYSGLGQWRLSHRFYSEARAVAPGTRGALYAEANLCVHAAHTRDREQVYEMCERLREQFEEYEDEVGYYFTIGMQLGLAQMLRWETEFRRLADVVCGALDRPNLRILQLDVWDSIATWHLEADDLVRASEALGRVQDVVAGDIWSHDGNWFLIRQAELLRRSDEPAAGLQLLIRHLPLFCSALGRVYGWAEVAACARDLGDVVQTEQAETVSAGQLRQLGASKQIAVRHIGAMPRRMRGVSVAKDAASPLDDFIGRASSVTLMKQMLAKLARTNCTILLTGESGTGKSMLALLVHGCSPRADKPFVRVDVACNDEGLLESVLFGHERGAFTGAVGRRQGLVECAQHGTLFLDEIAELPVAMQSKLLTLLEEGTYRPVGAPVSRKADVRVILATNRTLESEIQAGRFRADLFYRTGLEVRVPPLKERQSDIPFLCRRVLDELNSRAQISKRFGRGVVDALAAAEWPGNVRQLKRSVERGFYLSEGAEITTADCSLDKINGEGGKGFPSLEEVERSHINEALAVASGNKSEAARLLGVKRTTLYSKIDSLGLRGGDPY